MAEITKDVQYIIGISCFYHDSAAVLLKDGVIVAAAQEERFTRVKQDATFPINAVEYCLKEASVTIEDIDLVSFYEKPILKFERLLETYGSYAPAGFLSFSKAMHVWLTQKLWIPQLIEKELNYSGKIIFPEHHQSHAASAFFPSPYTESAFLTLDGVGEWCTTSWGKGKGNKIEISHEIHFPHSLGLLYSAFTYYLGFKVNSGEYKVMGLAPYGEPKYVDLIKENLIDVKDDGSYALDMSYFNYPAGLQMTSKKFHDLFGAQPRTAETELTQREMDIAKSLQVVIEEVVLKIACEVHKKTNTDSLCLSGGVALNCVSNGNILRNGPFKHVWIQPASGDAGGALGAALFAWYQYCDAGRSVDDKNDLMKGSYLGPSYSQTECEIVLDEYGASYTEVDSSELYQTVAGYIADEKVIGWFQGRMEFGPRALGHRSIIGDSRSKTMQSTMNLKIKYRESFRPFAPSILSEYTDDFFCLDGNASPYMLITADVVEEKRVLLSSEEKKLFGIDSLNLTRSVIPAVTHVDYSARVQSVHKEQSPEYHKLISAFYGLTKCPLVVNTSFNVRGEPIVCSPNDAYRCFMRTEMDYLVLGNLVLKKEDQPVFKDLQKWEDEYELD